MPCELCEINDGFIITTCNHCDVPMIISREHKPIFSVDDVRAIKELFPTGEIRWEMKKIRDHAHAHIT